MTEYLELLKNVIGPNEFHLVTKDELQAVDVNGTLEPGDYLVGKPYQQIPSTCKFYKCVKDGPNKPYMLYPLETFSSAVAELTGEKKRKKISDQDDTGGTGRSDRVCSFYFGSVALIEYCFRTTLKSLLALNLA